MTKEPGFATQAIHAGYHPREAKGALTPPVYLTSTFAFEHSDDLRSVIAREAEGFAYGRVSNPTQRVLQDRLAALEGGEAAVATASGMGAIAALFWTFMRPGDEVVVDKTLYGCTFTFLNRGLAEFGIKIVAVDLTDIEQLTDALTERTRIVFFETPANPNMRIIDIGAVAAITRAAGIRLVVDNTYATPYLQRPLAWGADLVVHSATKFLGGHGDLIAGAVIGSQEDIEAILLTGLKDMTGSVISPFTAFLILRGLKTLALRMERHSDVAQQVAEFLDSHPAVAKVHYPGLENFPQEALARRLLRRPGGMLAFELHGDLEAGTQFMDRLQLISRAVSLGDAQSLIQHPASMTHADYTPEERESHFISERLLRLSVGLEEPEDLIEDLSSALETAQRG